ncbi:MAG: cyclic peptide export ABC transporter [Stellaceae bacterium]
MNFLRLLRSESAIDLKRLFAAAVIAGLSNAMVLAVVNAAADPSAQAKGAGRLAIMFIVVLIVYSISQRYLMFEASKEVERIIHRVRSRLTAAVRDSELAEIERIGRTRIYNAISKEIQALAQNTNTLVAVSQMSLLVVFATLYLLVLSPTAFVIAIIFMSIAVAMYLGRLKVVNKAIQDSIVAEFGLHDLLEGILEGFKEVKLNALRSQQISDDLLEASLDAAESRVTAQSELTRNYVFTQNVFFLLLATMVFVVPLFSDIGNQTIVKLTTAILFVTSAIAGVVSSVPIFINANASAANIMDLQRAIGAPPRLLSETARTPATAPSFRRITIDNVAFTYGDGGGSSFRVGPFNVTFDVGETVFISGGNGSGKSTFMRLLTSLYWPKEGQITIDGAPVTHDNVETYRALFAAVFSEYHLFKRLYGVAPGALDEIPELLKLFEIEDKTAFSEGTFSTVDLSAGQRKRVALIVALLERRPICVLDEWAADQDPLFRRKFYEELLPMFKARGMTVIAVSHDDRYFHVADRHLHMEEGRIVSDLRRDES